jgi:outer membrane protein assembly factor BamB
MRTIPARRWPSLILAAATVFAAGIAVADTGANWPRWRGPHDNGSNESGSYPVKWDASINVLWKTPLPGKGCSTPIVWNERIYLTAPSDGQDTLLAFDWSGKRLWQTPLGPERAGKNRNGSGSNPSPATDGTAIFTCFKSGNLAASEMDGKVRWKTNLLDRFGKDTLYWDYGTSPVLTEKDVVATMMHHGESYIAAFDKITGELRWKVARNFETPTEGDHSYATPIAIRHEGKEALLVWGGQHLTAHDAATGATLWSCGDFNPESKNNWVAVASPVIAGDIAVVPYGRGSRLHGIRLGGKGDVTATHRAWVREDTGSFVPTPIEYKGRIYLVRDQGRERGQVECVDPANGKTLWTGELPKGSSTYYSSPAAADGKLYAAREDGVIFVAKIEGSFEVLSENKMGEPVIASPVPVANRLLIRGEKNLFCIAAPK